MRGVWRASRYLRSTNRMRNFKILSAIFGLGIVLSFSCATVLGQAKRAATGQVCGDPTAKCAAAKNFQPFDLPFETGANWVIVQSKPFYGIVLKSVKVSDWVTAQSRASPNQSGSRSRSFFRITRSLRKIASNRERITIPGPPTKRL